MVLHPVLMKLSIGDLCSGFQWVILLPSVTAHMAGRKSKRQNRGTVGTQDDQLFAKEQKATSHPETWCLLIEENTKGIAAGCVRHTARRARLVTEGRKHFCRRDRNSQVQVMVNE